MNIQDENILKILTMLENIMEDDEKRQNVETIIKEIEEDAKGHETLLQFISLTTNIASLTIVLFIKNELENINNNLKNQNLNTKNKLDSDFIFKILGLNTDKTENNYQNIDLSEIISSIFKDTQSKDTNDKDVEEDNSMKNILNILSNMGLNVRENNQDSKDENIEKNKTLNTEECLESDYQEEDINTTNISTMYAEMISQYYDYILGAYKELNKMAFYPKYVLYGPIEEAKIPEQLKDTIKNNVYIFYKVKNEIENSEEHKCNLSITNHYVTIDGKKIEKKVEANAIKELCKKDNISFIEIQKANEIDLQLYTPQKIKGIQ